MPDEALADLETLGVTSPAFSVRIGGEQLQARRPFGLDEVDDAVLRIDQRCQLRQQHAADRGQVALALEHVGEARQVGLEPILLGVAIRRQAQIDDHRVEIVLELGHLAARVDLNGARQVALGDRRGDLGDGAHLGRQIGGQ